MFDWDKDVEGLIKTQAPTDQVTPAPTRSGLRSCSRLAMRLSVVLCLTSLGALAHAELLPWRPSPELVALGFVSFQAAQTPAVNIPLQVLDQAQANLFQTGLRAFSDADLLRYAQNARTDMAQSTSFMQPTHADAVALIEHEMIRRGL